MRKFIWNFHRFSGLTLIILLALKILTGFAMVGKITIMKSSLAHSIHTHPLLDISILLLFVFHALYGLHKIFSPKIDRSKHKTLFVTLNIIGGIVIILSLLFVYFM